MSARSRISAPRGRVGAALLGALLLGAAGAPAAAGPPGGNPTPTPAAQPGPTPPQSAQPNPTPTQSAQPGRDAQLEQPSESTALLAAVQARYETVQDLRARFEQRARVASLGREESSSGTLAVRRPGRMRWEYSAPQAHVLTLDGETLRMYVPAEKQLQIAALDAGNFSPTALSFLLGGGDLGQDFTAEALPAGAGGELGLRLRPRKDSGFEYLELWLVPGALTLRESVVVDLFGNRTSVRFEDVVENAGVPEAVFEIQVPPGTEVMDLR